MKRLIRYGVTVVVAGVAAMMSGQTETPNTSNSYSYIQISKLVGRKVKSSQGEAIGVIKDVVIDRTNGCMAYTVVSTGGEGTTVNSGGGKIVAVPWTVYSSTSDPSVLRVNVDRDKIYNAPVFEYTRIDEYARPDYKDNIYSYYGVNSGPRTVAAVSGGAGTDASGTAGATVSPGEAASPGAAATASPNKRSPARAQAASAASSDEGSSESPSPKRTRSARAIDTPPPTADETASSESPSESTTNSSDNKTSRRKAITETPKRRPSATPQLPEGED
jgi:sporulation protein YlmC with PRC-barrel domain